MSEADLESQLAWQDVVERDGVGDFIGEWMGGL